MDDYRVKGRSNLEICQLAKKTRVFFGIAEERRVDVLACLASKSIWTVNGKQRLNFQVRPDVEMGTADGMTSHGKDVVTIAIKQSVRDAAFMGDGRARNTLAHELGHAVMHHRNAATRPWQHHTQVVEVKAVRIGRTSGKSFRAGFLDQRLDRGNAKDRR